MTQHSCKWTFPSSQQVSMCPMPQPPAGHQLQSPLHKSPWNIPPNQRAMSAWLLRSRELLSCAALDTSSQASGSSTPKRLTSMPLGDPSSPTVEDPPKLLDTSSQASPWVATPHVAKPSHPTNQNSWGWCRGPPWGSNFTPGRDEQSNGVPTDD